MSLSKLNATDGNGKIGGVIAYITSISILGNFQNYFWNYNRRISEKVIYQRKTLFSFSITQLFDSFFFFFLRNNYNIYTANPAA